MIDHIYCNCDKNISHIHVPRIGISDHYPVYCSRKVNFKEKTNSHNFIKYRSFKTFSEQAFISDLINVPWGVMNTDANDANDVLNTWVSNFSSVVNNHIPVKIHRVKNIQQPDWLNPAILDEIKERDKFKTNGEINSYKKSRNKVNILINNSKKSSYERKIEEGKSDPKSIWKIFREHGASSKNKKNCNPINNIKINDRDVSDKTEIANEFNDFFCLECTFHSRFLSEEHCSLVRNTRPRLHALPIERHFLRCA